MTGFGECANCGCGVERVGWDDLCFGCQELEKDLWDFAEDDSSLDYVAGRDDTRRSE